MLAPVTQQYRDLSTPESFAFVFYCDLCGQAWQSSVYAFDPRGFEPPMDEKIRCMLWNQQHEEAYERANREAGARLFRCPTCGCRVCDDCFRDAPPGEPDRCKDCLKEKEGKQTR